MTDNAATTALRAVVVEFGQKANRPGDATNAPGHDTEEVTSMPDKLTSFPARVMNLGITRAGGRVHRLSDADPVYSPCGQYLSRRFVKTPLEVAAPLCELCFEPEERHALVLAEMETA